MDTTFRCFLAPKLGEELEDCEDSIFPPPGTRPLAGGGVFAVSDGTTTSFFSALWSRILSRRFATEPAAAFDSVWCDWLRAAQQEWQAAVRTRAEAKDASFYTRNDFLGRRAAAATFVGLQIEPPGTDGAVPWRALVLGDSCLFILGKDGPHSLELTKAEEFSNMVKAAESYETAEPHLPKAFGSSAGGPHLAAGDVVLLATDALSKWLLARAEIGKPVWASVLALGSDAEFTALIADARREAEGELDNDDVALVVVRLGSPHERYNDGRFEPNPKPEKPPAPPSPPPPPTGDIPKPVSPLPAAPVVPPKRPPIGSAEMLAALRRSARSPWCAVALAGLLALVLALGKSRTRRDAASIAVRDSDIATLREQLAASATESAGLRGKLGQADADNAALRSQHAKLTAELAALGTERDGTKKQQAALAAKLAEAEKQCATLGGELTSQKQKLATTTAMRDELQKALAAQLAEADREKAALAAQYKQAAEADRKKLEDANAKITTLETDTAALKKTISELEQQIKELKASPPGAAQGAATFLSPTGIARSAQFFSVRASNRSGASRFESRRQECRRSLPLLACR